MTIRRPFILLITIISLTISVIPFIFPSVSHCAGSEVRIGVLANHGKEAAMKTWSGTASYLSGKVPRHLFTIVPLDVKEQDQKRLPDSLWRSTSLQGRPGRYRGFAGP